MSAINMLDPVSLLNRKYRGINIINIINTPNNVKSLFSMRGDPVCNI